jgi:subtilisin family serine protease
VISVKMNPAYVCPDYSCEPNEIVVDASYEKLLRGYIRKIRGTAVTVQRVDEIKQLELVRLVLGGLTEDQPPGNPGERFDRRQCQLLDDEGNAKVRAAVREELPSVTPVEALIQELRVVIAEEHGGWLPEFSSNHTMHGVVGFPQSKPLAFGSPESIDRPASWSTPAPDASLGAGVRVGVLDTRVAVHPALAGHFTADPSKVLAHGVGEHQAWEGHATFVTGLIVQQAPAAEIIVKPVLLHDGRATVWETAAAIVEFDAEQVDVLNLSLGCRTTDGIPPLVLRRAIDRIRRECVVVAAAGNHGQTNYCYRPTWPAALPGVVAVGALTDLPSSGEQAPFSPKLPWVDVLAKGVAVESTYLQGVVTVLNENGTEVPAPFDHGFARWTGTSFAAATVTGAIAARTVPEKITARAALTVLLDRHDIVTRYVNDDDRHCA